MTSLKNSIVLITGGTGTFGTAFLDKCISEDAREIRIFSRDEKKQYDMAQKYRANRKVKFFLGDVRDRNTIHPAMKNVDYVFHAAAMKQVPSCEAFPMEAVKTNIIGSENVINEAIECGVKKIVCLSTDKAVYPTSAMGMTKAYMEKIALQKAYQQEGTEICITRFGNLIASRGSAVPVFMEQVENGLPITVTEPEMTRFMMTVQEAADLVSEAFSLGKNGQILVKKSRSCTTGDLAYAVMMYLGVSDDYPVIITGMRPGEKMHESLLTEEEADCAVEVGDYLVSSKDHIVTEMIDFRYKSNECERMDKIETLDLIRKVFGGES